MPVKRYTGDVSHSYRKTIMLSIGVDEQRGIWKTCLMEDGQVFELSSFEDTASVLTYLEYTCATYPEPVLMVALDKSHWDAGMIEDFLIAIDSMNLNSYTIPPLSALSSLPSYRRLMRGLGEAHVLCNVVTLLYRMRRRDAAWQEMRFLFLDVNGRASSVAVIEEGRIVNGMVTTLLETRERQPDDQPTADSDVAEEAFWEQLTQTLGGLLAVHHIEDIVILGDRAGEVIARLDGSYQFYLFPRDQQEHEGYEAATGAALLAEGFYAPGIAAEVVERLHISLVQSPTFS